MMKFLFILFGVVAGVSEEQESRIEATKAEVVKTLAKISEGDTTRKVLFKSALKTVSGIGATVTPDEYNKLQNVSDLLDELLQTFQTEVQNRNNYVNGLLESMGDCDTQGSTELGEFVANLTSLGSTHITCRAAHHDEFQTKMTRYSNLMSWMANVDSHVTHTISWTPSLVNETHGASGTTHVSADYDLAAACALPQGTTTFEGGGIEADILDGTYERFIEASHTWFDEMETEFVTIANYYTQAAENYNTDKITCDQDQENYENQVCAYVARYNQICNERSACWQAVRGTNTFSNLNDFTEDNTNVPELVRLIKYIQCIIAEIQANVTETTAAARDTCAWWMNEDLSAGDNGNYSDYYINVSGLDSSTNWPVANNCSIDRYNSVINYLPFSKATPCTGGSNPTSYRCDIQAEATYQSEKNGTAPTFTAYDDYWVMFEAPAITPPATCVNIDPTA